MWKFFKRGRRDHRKISISGFMISGGDGLTLTTPIVISPLNRNEIRLHFRKKLRSSPLSGVIATDDGVDAAISEMTKRKYLIERFGAEEKEWKFGAIHVLPCGVSEQTIVLADGNVTKIYFDFSNIFTPITTGSQQSSNAVVIDESRPGATITLHGTRRSFPIEEHVLTVLLAVAFDGGWPEGENLLKQTLDGILLKPIRPGLKISRASSLQLAKILEHSLPQSDDEDEEIRFCHEFIRFATEGGFTIDIAFQN